MEEKNQFVRQVAEQKYEFGFTTDVHTEIIEKGLNEDVVRLISAKKGEPEWMLEFRLKAFRYWKEQTTGTEMGSCACAPHRLSGYFILCRPYGKEKEGRREGGRE